MYVIEDAAARESPQALGVWHDETCIGTGVANVCLNDSYNSYTLVANSQKDPVLIVMKWPTRNISHMEENHEDCNHL